GEGVRRGEVVDVEDAEHRLDRSHQRRAHGAPHALDEDRLAFEPLVGRRVVRQDGDAVLDHLAGDRLRHVLRGRRLRRPPARDPRHELTRRGFEQQDRDAVHVHHLERELDDLVEQPIELLLFGQLLRALEPSSRSSTFFSRSSSSDLALTFRCDAPDGAAVTIAGTPPDTLTGSWRTIVPPAGFAPVNSADPDGTTCGRAAGALTSFTRKA